MLLANSVEGKSAPFLQRIENVLAEIESAKGKYMAEAKTRREDIKEIYGEAKDAGVPKKALQGLVRYRELEKKQNAIADGLDIDEQSTFEVLVEALGDFGQTELGQATLDLAKKRDGKKAAKAGGAETASAPYPAAVKAASEADIAAAPAEVAKGYTERLREKNAVVDKQLKTGGLGTEPASHQVQ